MSEANLIVEFPVHSPADRIASLASGIAAYGNVRQGASPLELHVTVFRMSKLPKLKDQLTTWEAYGFLRWRVVE
jgi:hypothetical protein